MFSINKARNKSKFDFQNTKQLLLFVGGCKAVLAGWS